MEPINYLFIALLSWGLIYRLFHSRSRMVVTSPVEDIPLGSLNGFGITMLGGFRSSTSSDYAVYYVMLTALWMPIIPVGCVIASREGTHLSGFLPGINTEYRVYGKSRWNGWELISIYALRWGIVLSLFFLLG